MITDTEVGRRAAAWFASIPHPAGTTFAMDPQPLIVHELAIVFGGSLAPASGAMPTLGNGPVAVDRRNGALTPLGTGGSPAHLFDKYLADFGATPPPALADPPASTEPAPPLAKRPHGRPTQALRPKGPVPPRPWPPPDRRPPGTTSANGTGTEETA